MRGRRSGLGWDLLLLAGADRADDREPEQRARNGEQHGLDPGFADPGAGAPVTIAPAAAPRSAPTIPAQKRSGMKTVKCQIATPVVNQTSAAI